MKYCEGSDGINIFVFWLFAHFVLSAKLQNSHSVQELSANASAADTEATKRSKSFPPSEGNPIMNRQG